MLSNEVSPQQLFLLTFFLKLLDTVKSWKHFHLKEILFWFLRPAKKPIFGLWQNPWCKRFSKSKHCQVWLEWTREFIRVSASKSAYKSAKCYSSVLFTCWCCRDSTLLEVLECNSKICKYAFPESHYLLLMLLWVTPSWKIKTHVAPSCSEFGYGSEY